MDPDQVFREHRRFLFGLAYRMLGSVQDAEDVVQEGFLRWQRADHGAIDTPKAWLATVVTRLSIDQLRSATKRREVYVGEWLPEPLVTDDGPDREAELAESLSTAFLLMLERLSPQERAGLLLKDVFDYDYGEIAGILEKNEAACRQMVKRARDRALAQEARFEVDPAEHEGLVLRLVDATQRGDVEALMGALAEDATLHTDHGGKAIAARRVLYGPSKVARFLVGVNQRFAPADAEVRVQRVNGEPGIISYSAGHADTVLTFEFRGGKVQTIYATRNPDKLKAVPVPESLN